LLECYHCGAKLDVTMAECPTCGAEVEMGRLTGILGVVCRSCDAYNEPGTRTCVSCGQPLSVTRPAPATPAGSGSADPFAGLSVPSPGDLPPMDLDAFAAVPVAADPTRPPTTPPATPAPRPPPPPGPAARPDPAEPAPASGPAAASAPPSATPSFFGELDLDLPVHWTTPQAAPLQPPARPAPPGASAPEAPTPPRGAGLAGTGPDDQTQPIPLVTACPSCGAEAGAGSWCVHCGQPLGGAHTRILAAAPRAPGQRSPSQIFGPLEPGKASLVLERGEGFDGAVFRLSGNEVGAGRSQGFILFPNDGALAPLHATFLYRDGQLYVRDEGSAGGTFLRLRGLTVPLRAGDLFALGDRLLRFAGLLPPSPPPSPDGTRRLGSPRPQGPAVVVEERLEGGATGRTWIRPGPSVTLGRAGCSVNLGDDPFLSQAHAEILVEPDGAARLRDLGSSNGTFVRLPPRAERELQDGDLVRLGREVLRVVSAPI